MSYEECFKQLSGLLQIEQGMKNCQETPAFYYQMLKSVAEYVPRKIAHLEECLKQKDYEGYIIEVHTLKSNAALIGAVELSEEAKRLEYAGKEKRYEEIKDKTEALIAKYKEMIAAVQEVLENTDVDEGEEDGQLSEEEKKQCHEVLCDAAEEIAAGRYDEVLDLIEVLEIYAIPVAFMGMLKQAQTWIREGKYMRAAELMERLKGQI